MGSTFLYFEYRHVITEPEVRLDDPLLAGDCGVVLTGSAGRIRESFEILAQKRIKKLVISGVYRETQLLEIFPHLPLYPEISESDVILEKKSESTYGNAVQSLALVQALQCRHILLITSQLHMYRAHRIFKQIYPAHIEIRKFPISIRKDFTIIDYTIETVKSASYWTLERFLEIWDFF